MHLWSPGSAPRCRCRFGCPGTVVSSTFGGGRASISLVKRRLAVLVRRRTTNSAYPYPLYRSHVGWPSCRRRLAGPAGDILSMGRDGEADTNGARHGHHHRHQAASDLPRRPLGRVAGRPRSSPTRPTRRRPPARRTTRPRRSTRRRSRPPSPRSRSPGSCRPTSAAGSCARSARGSRRGARSSAGSIALEAGKPIRDALVEVDRATLTFRLGAEEAERMTGELIPLDLHAGVEGPDRHHPPLPDRPDRRRSARSTSRSTWPPTSSRRRSPSGNPIVLKPPSKDPLTMLDRGRDHRGGRRPGRARSRSCR